MTLFDLLSLFYAFIGARTLWQAWQGRRELTDTRLTAMDRRLTDQLAFFVLVPPGVFLHELGHALATLQLGGRVAEFHYALFWGYVVPVGLFSPLGEWWIAVSGNLVSILYGLAALPLLWVVRSDWQKYLLLSFARIQLTWSLIGYPLITFLGFEGDWKTIYSPDTWGIGLPFAVFHGLLILSLWLLNRSGNVRRWEVALYAGMGERLRELEGQIRLHPGDANCLLDRGNLFAQNNMMQAAQSDYRRALTLDPGNPHALYNLGQMELAREQNANAEKCFRAALARAVGDPVLIANTRLGLGLALFKRGARAEAVSEFDSALQFAPTAPELYYWRGMAQRGLGQSVRARADFQRAAQLAAQSNPRLAHEAQQMAQTMGGETTR